MSIDPLGAALELLAAAQEGDAHRPDDALSRDYWLELNPELSIEGTVPVDVFEGQGLAEAELAALASRIEREGWYSTPEILDTRRIAGLLAAVDRVVAAGWHPSFAFVYDELWLLPRTPTMRRLVSSVLGDGALQMPATWCHYVHTTKRASGWTPHVDGYVDRSRRLTAWVPLTEATLDNGCMYLIPKDLMPEGGIHADAGALLPVARAVPTGPGQVIGWDFEVYHWGSTSSGRAATPRVSLSLEFIAADAEAGDQERPLYPLDGPLPGLDVRLHGICTGVLRYARFEPTLLRYADVARKVGARVEKQS